MLHLERFSRIKQRLPRRNLFLKRKPSVAKEKMEPVTNGNEFCGTLLMAAGRKRALTRLTLAAMLHLGSTVSHQHHGAAEVKTTLSFQN